MLKTPPSTHMKTCLPFSLTEPTVSSIYQILAFSALDRYHRMLYLCPQSREQDPARPQGRANSVRFQILEGCSAQHAPQTFCCILTRHQHATNLTVPLCASHDTSVADMVLHVLTPWSMDPSEKNQCHRLLASKISTKLARSCTKRVCLGTVQRSHRTKGNIHSQVFGMVFLRQWQPGHRPSTQILLHHPRRAERTNGVLPSLLLSTGFDRVACEAALKGWRSVTIDTNRSRSRRQGANRFQRPCNDMAGT